FGVTRHVYSVVRDLEERLQSMAFWQRFVRVSALGGALFPLFMLQHLFYMIPALLWFRARGIRDRLAGVVKYLFCIGVGSWIGLVFLDLIGGAQFFMLEFSFKMLLVICAVYWSQIDILSSLRGVSLARLTPVWSVFTMRAGKAGWPGALIAVVLLGIPFAHMLVPSRTNFLYTRFQMNRHAHRLATPDQTSSLDDETFSLQSNTLSRDLFLAFEFIRDNTAKDRIVVAPDVVLPWNEWGASGRSGWVSALCERAVYVEAVYGLRCDLPDPSQDVIER
ncbi:unnamed protein product, partial [marine sediment metagenome]